MTDENALHAITFSPDGARLASAGGDGRIRIWDANDPGAEVVVLTVPAGELP